MSQTTRSSTGALSGSVRHAVQAVTVLVALSALVGCTAAWRGSPVLPSSVSTSSSDSSAGSSGLDEAGSSRISGLTATYSVAPGGGVSLHLTYVGNSPEMVIGNVCFENNGTTYIGTVLNINSDPASVEITMNPGTSYTIPDQVANAELPYVTAYFTESQPTPAAGASLPSGEYYYIGQCSDPTTAEVEATLNSGS
jgi:hypothetical protein